jgi:nicotinate-nucleotide pyrophosphorylase (carboxylating)
MPPFFDDRARTNAAVLITLAIAEDVPDSERDLTSWATIPPDATGSGRLKARAGGVVAGLPVVAMVAEACGIGEGFRQLAADGDHVSPGQAIAEASGSVRSLLLFERTALNFVQRLSGIASLTARYVAATSGTRAVVLDTRKTTPGWRALEKYAVRCGGGRNHRLGLFDAVLIKDNHIAWLARSGAADPVAEAVASARVGSPPGTLVEVEVDALEQLDRALASRPDVVLVDNLGPDRLAEAVRRRDAVAPTVLLEASGGVTLATVAALARAGADRISVGALTHSAPALDVGLDFDEN